MKLYEDWTLGEIEKELNEIMESKDAKELKTLCQDIREALNTLKGFSRFCSE